MGRQEAVFLKGEGDAWHERNRLAPANFFRNDVISRIIPKASAIVEIGCGDGRYLAGLRDIYGARSVGIDISHAAIKDGSERFPDLKLIRGTAQYRFLDGDFDLVIYGFCLYVCDPDSLLGIAARGDAILRDGGHLVIHDFDPKYPHKVPYHHVPGLYSYKMDYSKLWLANPAYSLVHKEIIGDGTAVWVLKKDIAAGWPEEAAP